MREGWRINKAIKITIISVLSVIVLAMGGFYFYVMDYYEAEEVVSAELLVADYGTTIEEVGKLTIFTPKENLTKTGFIFYPGGKVESTAYTIMLSQLANRGITVVLVKMPFNLAVFDINAANDVFKEVEGIDNWYLGGHSLGGAMASSYFEQNGAKVKGGVLLGAYPTNDAKTPILAVYGENDRVLDHTKLKSVDTTVEIKGGNHAYFGNYGDQKNDGKATISRESQQQQTIQAIMEFIAKTQS